MTRGGGGGFTGLDFGLVLFTLRVGVSSTCIDNAKKEDQKAILTEEAMPFDTTNNADEHTKNARPSSRARREKGRAAIDRSWDSEKGDREPPRRRPEKWAGHGIPRNLQKDSFTNMSNNLETRKVVYK
jgi:hypothetical protein